MPRVTGKGKLYSVTITHVDWSKDQTFYWLDQDECVKRYLVSEEFHDDFLARHHHVFIEYSEDVNLEYVRTCIRCLCDDLSIDVAVCKSVRSWLKYCTKNDFNPVRKAVRIDECSFGVQLCDHVENHYLGRYRNEIVEQRDAVLPNVLCGFTMRFNYWFDSKKGHMYMWRVPGIGKTELADFLMKGEKVWRPSTVNQYMWSGLTEEHEYVWFEDFRLVNYRSEISRLLSLMDGKPVSIQGKYKEDQLIVTKARFLFTSNEQDDVNYPEFSRRVEVLGVDHQMFCCPGGGGCG
ncbi:unnamed protein product, partial [Didymodactylos carnosus]